MMDGGLMDEDQQRERIGMPVLGGGSGLSSVCRDVARRSLVGTDILRLRGSYISRLSDDSFHVYLNLHVIYF
jgi:hypothetical protein